MDNLDSYFIKNDPIATFRLWHEEAMRCEQNADAMVLSTVSGNRPNSRTVLFKGLNEGGLSFFTNFHSPKARDLELNPEGCLVFYWHVSKRQVRLHGRVKRLSRAESVKYFESRDKESQLASYISDQSATIADKKDLEDKLNQARLKFQNTPIPTPENWGGFVLEPYEIEFFVYGEHRLNDRFLFKYDSSSIDGKWVWNRLQP